MIGGGASSSRAPALARWLVSRLVRSRHREEVLGDLEEEFGANVRRGTRARLRYWRGALGSIVASRSVRGSATAGHDRLAGGRRRGTAALTGVGQDVRLGIRQLRSRPVFSLTVIVTLGLGIGATTSVFSLINWLLFRPTPGVSEPDGLVTIELRSMEDGRTRGFGWADLMDFEAGARSIAALGMWESPQLQISAPDGRAVAAVGEVVAGDYFGVLGVRPAAGRLIGADETDPRRPVAVAVVSSAFAADLFGVGVDPIGRVVRVNATPVEIVGVMDPAFRGVERFGRAEIWLPYSIYADLRHFPPSFRGRLAGRGSSTFRRVVARLAPGATAASADAELAHLAEAMLASHPDEAGVYATYRPRVTPGAGMRPDRLERSRRTSALMLGAVALLLAIVCANVANLLIFHGVSRRGEAAVRRALGASGGRMLRHQLTESLVLACAGGALGVGIVWVARGWFGSARLVGTPAVGSVPVDARVLLFASAVALAAGLITGLAPTALSRNVDLNAAMRGAEGRATSRRAWFRRALVVVQLGLTLPLVAGAVLLVQTVRNLLNVEVGFEPAAVQMTLYDLEPQGYADESVVAFHAGVLAGLRSEPAIGAASISSHAPFSGVSSGLTIAEDAAGREPGGAAIDVDVEWIAGGFFDVLGLRVEEGRALRGADVGAAEAGPQNVVISRSLARALYGDRPAIGRSVSLRGFSGPTELRVVGVAADARLRGPATEPEPVLYQPIDASIHDAGWVMVRPRAGASAADVQAAVRAAIARMDPSIPSPPLAPLAGMLAGRTAEQRLLATLLAAVAALAAMLAAIGLYGLLSAMLAERDREIGIRIALGAAPRRIASLVAAELAGVTVGGLMLGAAGGVAAGRIIASRLFGVAASDPLSLTVAAAVVPLVALAAALVPARRAARIDPAVMLRGAGEKNA